jgi:hypothetical protein
MFHVILLSVSLLSVSFRAQKGKFSHAELNFGENGMFNRSYLQNEFEKLNRLLTENVTLYLIGGGAMSFLGLKDATKDIDVIVRTQKELEALKTALDSTGYTVPCIRGPYKDMQANLILEKDDGFRWDIFQNVVCNGFQLSEGMIKRTESLISLEMLTVRLISPEDIFVFKSISSREGDLADMYTLFMQVLDFEAIREEVSWQNAHDQNFAWLAFFTMGSKNSQINTPFPIQYSRNCTIWPIMTCWAR